MFSSANRRARFRLRNGGKVTVHGRVTIYSPRRDYQLIADSMEEAGAGGISNCWPDP